MIVGSVLTLVFPDHVVDEICALIIKALKNAPFSGTEVFSFLTDHYLPAFRKATANLKIGPVKKLKIARKGIGAFMKFLYALPWQEEIFKSKLLLQPWINKLGAELMPSVNALADDLTGFSNSDEPVRRCSVDVYPGAGWCRPAKIPHAKWHESTANGFYDLIQLGDYLGELYRSGGDLVEDDRADSAQVLKLSATAATMLLHDGFLCWRNIAFGAGLAVALLLGICWKLYREVRKLRSLVTPVGRQDNSSILDELKTKIVCSEGHNDLI